ncbi:FecR domain-containing protein [Variovorax sp. H27-G14]|uniref:FecR family protein n=1 Tax=Variovorax sp. H27-G14 TaxID=3111914 RepID=UPI0038FD0FE6
MTEAERIESAAADWLARRDSGHWSEADQQQLDAWIAVSIAHRIAWLRLESVWQRSDRLSALRAPPAPAFVPIPLPVRAPAASPSAQGTRARWLPRFSTQRIAASMLLAAAGVSWLGWRYTQDWQSEHYATAVGARQLVSLADGSRLTLNTDTQLRTLVNASGRKVWLEDGEAYFDIAHDKKHPFVVIAGDRRITVLGTRFVVRRQGEQVNVVVEEGRVQIASAQDATGDKAAAPTVITRNQAAVANAGNVLVVPKAPKQIDDELSWRQGKLVFDQTTLADAATQFNRYNTHKLVIADAAIARIRIGGSFDAANMAGFVALLKQGFGLAVQEHGNETRISN